MAKQTTCELCDAVGIFRRHSIRVGSTDVSAAKRVTNRRSNSSYRALSGRTAFRSGSGTSVSHGKGRTYTRREMMWVCDECANAERSKERSEALLKFFAGPTAVVAGLVLLMIFNGSGGGEPQPVTPQQSYQTGTCPSDATLGTPAECAELRAVMDQIEQLNEDLGRREDTMVKLELASIELNSVKNCADVPCDIAAKKDMLLQLQKLAVTPLRTADPEPLSPEPLNLATRECASSSGAEQQSCLSSAFTREDARLNASYRETKGRLADREAEELLSAQRAWISARDIRCGGSPSSTEPAVIDCMVRLTADRATELEAM